MQSRLKAGTVYPKSSIINLELAPQELSATGSLAVRREMVYLRTSVQATLTSQTTTSAVMRYFSLVSPVEVNLHFLTPSSLLQLTLSAFTARSIAGLIGGVGLLSKDALPYLAEVVKDFENRSNPTYRPTYPNIPFPKKPSARDPRYRTELEKVLTLPQIKEMFADLVSAWSFKVRNWYQSYRSLGNCW